LFPLALLQVHVSVIAVDVVRVVDVEIVAYVSEKT
jgi:hypothetical protein